MSKYHPVQQTDAEAVASSVVAAKEAAPFDVEAQRLDAGDNHDINSLRVKAVAPCGLPPRYILPVYTRDGQVFDIRVPETGVVAGQIFEGTMVPVKRVTGRFRDDLLGCGTEGCFCGVATCFPPIAIATIMESLKLNPCGGRSGSRNWRSTFYVVAAVWAVLFVCCNIRLWTTHTSFIFDGMLYGTSIYMVVVATRTRWAFRQVYQIPGHCFLDCLVSYFCNCCSALQMYRHMKASGERPMRFESTIVAVKV
jgi:Cys-rich protein (TIGR01571 family)